MRLQTLKRNLETLHLSETHLLDSRLICMTKELQYDRNNTPSQRFAVIHIGKSLEKPTHKPKLAKEYACPIARQTETV